MMKTIMRNLISNSLKFTHKGGKISISTAISGKFISITVKDSGIGMPETLTKDLFKIDVRTSRKGTENEPSTGLGLLLCKEFIEIHKGKISIISEEGKGSEITVSLPLI
jgi:signal transduction histidine kinase